MYTHIITVRNAIRKYGKDAFEVCPLLTCKIEDMTLYEDQFIASLNTLVPNGYNLKGAGRCGRASDVTRKKMSESMIGTVHETSPVGKATNRW